MLKKLTIGGTAAALALAAAATASAGSAVVDGLGGQILMNSAEVPGVFGGPGDPTWDGATLSLVHDALHDDGISTDGLVTLVLLDTDHGLAFAALVDDNTQSGTGDDLRAQLGMTSTAPITGVEFINDNGEDIQNYFDNGNQTQTASGHFTWNADRRGDGFSWANLQQGDFVSFNFTRNGPDFPTHPGLQRNPTFQFVSWNGQSWEVIDTGRFTSANQFAFSFTIIPIPAPVAIGLVGLGVAAFARRRMMKRA